MFSQKSLIVLPFLNSSADSEHDYFADGITEELINALSKVKGLQVIARTTSFSYKGKGVDVRIIGNELGVNLVLEGSIRTSGNRVRIAAQLIRTDKGFQMWSERYDRELDDIFALQDEISLVIAERIREQFGHLTIEDHLVARPTQDLAAYDAYLRARSHHLAWDGQGIRSAIEYYHKAISIDPTFSWSYFGLAYSYTMFGSWGNRPELLNLAEDCINKGFDLDPDNFLGHYALATLQFWGRWDFKSAFDSYHRCIALNPSYTEAEEGLVELLMAIQAFDLAENHINHILKIDPLSSNHHYTKANLYYHQGAFSQAKDHLKKSLAINPNFTHSIERLHTILIIEQDKAVFRDFQKTQPLLEWPEAADVLFRLVKSKDISLLNKDVEQLLDREDKEIANLIPWKLLLMAHSGRIKQAIDFLKVQLTNKQGQYMNVQSMPFLSSLKTEQGFDALIRKAFNSLPQSKEFTIDNTSEEAKLAKLSVEEQNILQRQLSYLMEEEKVFIDAKLSLRSLSEKLNVHPNKLSWLLNEVIGHSFNEFVNQYRLVEFKKRASSDDSSHLTILGLAYESGFNSKSVFNDFFKRNEGVTPSKWLKNQM